MFLLVLSLLGVESHAHISSENPLQSTFSNFGGSGSGKYLPRMGVAEEEGARGKKIFSA